jgi:pimeloyl-ACP methyl ester carboxylesterase
VKFLEVAGVPTRCLYAGDEAAFPLLLIHGRALIAEVWLRNIDELGKDFFVVAPDVLGNGFTGPPAFNGKPALGARLNHLLGLVEALGWKRFAACGSSQGSLLAALIYLKMPDRVTKLILNGSAACASDDEDLAKLMQQVLKNEPLMGTSTLEQWRERCGKAVFDASMIPPELPALLMTAYGQSWVRDAWKTSLTDNMNPDSIKDYRVLHRLGEIKVDTLVPWGLQDHGAPYESGVKMVKAMPNARLEPFDCCGHMPMLEHPQRFNELARSFLRT